MRALHRTSRALLRDARVPAAFQARHPPVVPQAQGRTHCCAAAPARPDDAMPLEESTDTTFRPRIPEIR